MALFVGLVSFGCGGGSGKSTAGSSTPSPPSSPSPPVLSLVTNGTTGVAPLAVFFDASATTALGVTHPYHQLFYVWDFGDSGAGTWGPGNAFVNSKNFATGPVAAHIFDPPPGTGQQVYTVTLSVYDTFGNTASTTRQITVDDPNATFAGPSTICIGASTTPTAGADGCPSGASVQQESDWPTILSTYVASNKRVLLKHGDIFSGGEATLEGSKSGGIIGTYQSGAYPPTTKAIIRTTQTASGSVMLRVRNNSNFRLMDLEFDGELNGNRQAMQADTWESSNFTLLRLNIHDIGGAMEFALDLSNALSDGFFLHDSSVTNMLDNANAAGHGLLIGSARVSLQGNLFSHSDNGTAEHMMRLQFLDRAVISHNQIDHVQPNDPPGSKEMIALRSPCSTSAGCSVNNYFDGIGLTGAAANTRKVTISDNYIEVNTYAGIEVGGVADTDSWWVENVILERNYWKVVNGATPIRAKGGHLFTIRNELINYAAASGGNPAVWMPNTFSKPAATNVFSYNNTIFGTTAVTGTFVGFDSDSGGTGVIMNNIIAVNSATNPDAVANAGNATESNNSNDIQADTVIPFLDTTPTSPGDFTLDQTKYAEGGGLAGVPAFDDYKGLIRDLGNMDVGAFAYNIGSLP